MRSAPLRRFVAALAVLLCTIFLARPAAAEPGDELTVYVLTFGPGDHAFFKFGHDAIWIHNESMPRNRPLKRDAVYNWGTFAFGDPALIPKFVLGRFQYWLSKDTIDRTVAAYRHENRSVVAQELNLTAAEKKALLDMVEENAKEENKYYKYDYYRDNCATRVRDVVDKALGGKLKEASQAPATMTWREHTLRLTQGDAVLSMALTVVMGSVIDRPLNQWEEMFLPAYVQEGMRRVKVAGPGGAEVPLVKAERVLSPSTRPPVPTETPRWWMWTLLAGAAMGGGMFAAARSARGSLGARVGLGALLFLAGFLSILGVLFVFVWIATDHEVGWHNENILQLVPWGVMLMGYGIGAARLRPAAVVRARKLVTLAVGASVLGLVWKVLPWMRQDNYWFIAFCLPMWSGALLALRSLERSLPPPGATGEKKAPAGKPRAKGTPEKKAEGEKVAEGETVEDSAEPAAGA